MFSDIRGFTSLAESQPPEETIELLNTYYALMFEAISGHGGVVTVMMGDGLMSVFGAPMPLPDHAESAVRAAQEMVELIDLFNARAAGCGKAADQDRHRHRLRRDGGRIRRHQQARRPTRASATPSILRRGSRTHTKVAQRAILIDQATRSALSARITVEPLGPVPFKGKATAVDVFSVDLGQKL